MNLNFKISLLAISLLANMSALAGQPVSTEPQVSFNLQGQQQVKIEDAKWLSLPTWPEANVIQTSKKDGLQILDAQQHVLQKVDGRFGALDYRLTPTHLVIHTVDLVHQQAVILSLNLANRQWEKATYLPKTAFKIESVCLYQNQQNLFSVLVGEQGKGEQWIVGHHSKPILSPQRMRSLNFPVNSKFCFVNDQQNALFVNEENVGVWQYSVDPEVPFSRHIVDLVKPYGTVNSTPHAIAQVGESLWIVDGKSPYIYQYQKEGKLWKNIQSIQTNLAQPEQLSLKIDHQRVMALINDNHQLKQAYILDSVPKNSSLSAQEEQIVIVQPSIQTVPVPSAGDAADDPAIWHNPKHPEQSRILGTDKQGGLQVYDLKGKQTQYLAVGRLNNVDIRSDFNWNGKMVDLAVATNRDHNSLHLFAIQKTTGVVSEIGQLPTSLKDIYGLCMYKNRQGEIYAIPNDKDGTFIQYHIQGKTALKATEVKRFAVKTQPEGCVVDDQNDQIFLGEEDHAVWQLSLDPKQKTDMQAVIRVGEHGLKDDIEGMAIYHGATKNYLVISSQGNDSYVVVDTAAPYQYKGRFKIGMNLTAGIDAVTETDGLDVTSHNLGGVWKKGMLVVQDGHKVMPEDHQNFKYVSWADIAKALQLED